MNNGQNGQNSVNPQYGNSSNNYQYNQQGNGMVRNPQYNNQQQYGYPNQSVSNQNQGYPNMQGNYQYPQNQGYPNNQVNYQYSQQSQPQSVANNYQYGSNLNSYQKPNKNKKKLFLIIGGVVILIIVVILVIVFLGKGKNEKNSGSGNNSGGNAGISNEEIINQYGSKLETEVTNYVTKNGVLPDKKAILESTKLEDYVIECGTVEFHSSGRVYLDKCSIDGSEELYTYGEESDDSAIMKDYGAKALAYVSDYVKLNNGLPYSIDIKFDDKVECEVVKIYDAETIYLENCSINESEKKYSFGYPREDGYAYVSYTGYNNEIVGETTTANYLSEDLEKRQIKCATNKCSVDKFLGPYVALKESDGRFILHNIQSTSSLFTVASNLSYTFLEKDGTEVYGLLLRNQKGQEAIYSLSENEMKMEYGKYYYLWENPKEATNVWEKYSSVETKKLLLPVQKTLNGKYGLISLLNGKEILPFEYDSMFFDSEYINVVKNNKRGLISLEGDRVLLGGNFYEEFVLANYQDKYIMAYDSDQLQIINLEGKLVKKVSEIPRGYVLMKEEGYSPLTYKEENGKAIFTILFRTDKVGNPCAKYTYNLTNSTLNIDENKCEAFK